MASLVKKDATIDMKKPAEELCGLNIKNNQFENVELGITSQLLLPRL